MKQDKFEVSIDTETHTLYVDVTVVNKPEWKGLEYYNTPAVINKLNKQGYNVTERDCITKSANVRSDAGCDHEFSKGRWVFKLANDTNKQQKQTKESNKSVAKKVNTVTKKTTVKKQTVSTRKINKKTTSDALKEYAKKQDK